MQMNLNGIISEFYPFPEKYESMNELCTGMATRNPYFWVDSNRLVMTSEIVKNPHRMSAHCESDRYQWQFDPRLYFDRHPENSDLALDKFSQL